MPAPDTAQAPVDTAKTAAVAPKQDSSAAPAPVAEKYVVRDEAAQKPGAILPHKRIIAYYGNPLSKRMGVLGEYAPARMLQKLDEEVKAWNAADPATPAQPALHVIVVTAQGSPGKGGKYRLRMSDHVADSVISWAAG